MPRISKCCMVSDSIGLGSSKNQARMSTSLIAKLPRERCAQSLVGMPEFAVVIGPFFRVSGLASSNYSSGSGWRLLQCFCFGFSPFSPALRTCAVSPSAKIRFVVIYPSHYGCAMSDSCWLYPHRPAVKRSGFSIRHSASATK